ncbi:hypothetical protein [Bradyrhizobium canariense]|uniref:hypothetical protein n=1 Tax=Bradyrhizobium canariense TaxID=255045 RepID=UPI000A18C104|nr:hypothetical protein [Bradyrhizobium canariense]OSI20094.1 hypothetical protein BST65_35290 [Bradyrhizobium canariense]OSI26167.1 hypothetical protein BST66_38055 [Bradyrhizobium canariense]OSI37682.1 hypothetical protein BSZ20_38095 [Bradyrhizobium canariense]OSI42428.1 hypothetical protein BST67_37435 [Bradyrhizobium canariense]OSI57267.1 hypothetical protein BSZ15_14370 [Bradyrhizobium canariense]
MIGRTFMALARVGLGDTELLQHLALRRAAAPHVSKHRQYDKDGKRIPGKRRITEHSSLKKLMRVGEFKPVKMTPARRREFWHAAMRWRWNDIRNLATDLEKDRERRRLMRFAA